MKKIYAEAALYSYMEIDKCIRLIEQGMMKKALGSRNDTRYAGVIYDELIDKYVMKKVTLMKFKECMMKALTHMNKTDMWVLEYKYFGNKSMREKYCNMCHKEEQILNTFAVYLEKEGVTDEWFKNEGRNFINEFVYKARKKKPTKNYGCFIPGENKAVISC